LGSLILVEQEKKKKNRLRAREIKTTKAKHTAQSGSLQMRVAHTLTARLNASECW